MGSSKSKPDSPSAQQIRDQARLRAYNEELERKKAQLELEKEQWRQQQSREQFWKESQLREEQKRKDATLEWQRQADLRTLKLQQLMMHKELEQQKVQQKLMKEKLEIQLEKEKLQNALKEEQIQVHQHQPFQQVQPAALPSAPSLPCLRMRETVAVQQKASPGSFANNSPHFVPIRKVAEQHKVLLSSASSPAPFFVPKATAAAQQKVLLGSTPSSSLFSVSTATAAVQNKTSPATQTILKNLSTPKETQKSYLTRMEEANVKYTEWSIIDYIRDKNSISRQTAENVLKLFNENSTIPFIARYRRHLTEGMNEKQLRQAQHSYDQAKLIKHRAVTIVRDIDNKGLWTPEFHALVHETKSLDDLEHIYTIFINPKSKILTTAIANGLEIVVNALLYNTTPILDFKLADLVQKSVEGLKTEEQVKNGVIGLLADIIIKDRRTFKVIKKMCSTHQFEIQTTKGKGADKLKKHENIYELYYDFTSNRRDLKPDQVRSINKAEAVQAISVKINIPQEFEHEFKKKCLQQYGFIGSVPLLKKTLIDAAIDRAYNKSIKGFVVKRVRKGISDKAQNAASDGLAENVKLHLLAPPVRGKDVLGINPGFQNGSKFALVSKQGNVLETGTIYLDDPNNPRGKIEAERVLAKIICKHKCTIIAVGNGNGCKETEVFLTNMIKKNKKIPSDVYYTIVDKSSASIYSYGRKAALEFPNVEVEILTAVSIARRLQDPMAELVKIEPEQLTHDKHEQEMHRQLIVELVSHVGVDVNTASVSLLKNVAGLNEAKANTIIDWRRSRGPFTNRNDLRKIKGINNNTFEQCAGFLRIVPETAVAIGGQAVSQDSFNSFDQTWIHPEFYDIAKSLLEAAQCNVLELGTSSFIFTLNLYAQIGFPVLAKNFGTTEETIEMIVQGLRIGKGQDIRGNEDSAIFRKSLIRFNELNNGDSLFGVVTHLVEFGAFVDVRAEIDGLIHKNCMNGMTVKPDQLVEVKVSNIQKERGRLGLTLIQCH